MALAVIACSQRSWFGSRAMAMYAFVLLFQKANWSLVLAEADRIDRVLGLVVGNDTSPSQYQNEYPIGVQDRVDYDAALELSSTPPPPLPSPLSPPVLYQY